MTYRTKRKHFNPSNNDYSWVDRHVIELRRTDEFDLDSAMRQWKRMAAKLKNANDAVRKGIAFWVVFRENEILHDYAEIPFQYMLLRAIELNSKDGVFIESVKKLMGNHQLLNNLNRENSVFESFI